ncbi:MAG: aspartate kinase [Legionellales bacterium RIFCSPHIGHO2_12_FULL_37_14]|nr:MAG: aspartate kinase [Legionellales bacterium RIFCSPHIGHO2_12_FULL_37_14]
MALLVQKFGGTSLADGEKIRHAASIVAKAKKAGHDIVVIVSAMAGETDRLINLAKAQAKSPSPREYAALVATGEQVTMALMSMALQELNISAISFTGAQAGIHTCDKYKKARINFIEKEPILRELKGGKVVVVAGFQGVDDKGNITTLGRGGSDTSAVAVAAALDASECQIFTDVEGVFTTDPNLVDEACLLDNISFEEMLELASLGSKVLQIRSVEFAGKYNVPLRVLSSQVPGKGTLINYNQRQSMESPLVSGIAFSRKETKICLVGIKDPLTTMANLLTELKILNVNIDMLVEVSSQDGIKEITFTLQQDEHEATLEHLTAKKKELKVEKIISATDLAKLSLVGAGLKSHPAVVTTLFETLAAKKIPVELMSMSEIKISVIIAAHKLDEAVRVLHSSFQLDKGVNKGGKESYEDETFVVYSEN